MPQLDPKFLEFLTKTPSALAKFFDVLYEFQKLQGEIEEVEGDVTGPKRFRIGGRVEVDANVSTISREELDAVAKGMAEAEVKEKAIKYIKGFVGGLMIG